MVKLLCGTCPQRVAGFIAPSTRILRRRTRTLLMLPSACRTAADRQNILNNCPINIYTATNVPGTTTLSCVDVPTLTRRGGAAVYGAFCGFHPARRLI